MHAQHVLLRHVVLVQVLLALLAAAAVAAAVTQRLPATDLFPYAALAIATIFLLRSWARWRREKIIREAPLPQFLKRKLRDTYPHLGGKDADLVERGMRQFFMACHRNRRKFVAMPSKSVDAMWHEFILNTQAYKNWCQLALGYFLHHTPAEVLGTQGSRNDGLRRAWYWACKDEAIDPRLPSRLPLLFALDGKLGIEGGFSYVPDCRDIGRKSDRNGDGVMPYCGGSFSDSSASGDGAGFGGAESSGGDGGGDGSGCGGGGD